MPWASSNDLQMNALMALLVVVFVLSKVTQDEGTAEFWIILMPGLTYAIGCANARKKQAELRLTLARDMRESGMSESALGAFEDMVKQGLTPDEPAFNRAICACARLGRVDRALQVREQMSLYGFSPSGEAVVAMIRACAAAGRVGEALDIFEECDQPGYLAHRDAIHCYIEAERLGRAVILHKEMADSDMLPCAKTFQRLTCAVQEQGWTEIAAELSEGFSGWVKRTGALADDTSDASTHISENMGEVHSQ